MSKKLVEKGEEKKGEKEEKKLTPFEIIKKSMAPVIEKFGEDKIGLMRGSDIKREFISTGIDILDTSLGGGVVLGGNTLLYGGFGSGKSTLAYTIVAQAQKQGLPVLYIDAEGAWDSLWAEKQGIQLDDIYIVQGETLDINGGTITRLIHDKKVRVIVWDSICAVSPQSEKYERKTGELRELNEDTIGLLARQLSKFNRYTVSDLARYHIGVISISQVRANITALGSFGTSAQGGFSVQHTASTILRIKDNKREEAGKANTRKSIDTLYKTWGVEIHIEKHKASSAEGLVLDCVMERGIGFNNKLSTLNYAKNNGIILQTGAFYSTGEFKEKGWDNFVTKVMESDELYQDILKKLKDQK